MNALELYSEIREDIAEAFPTTGMSDFHIKLQKYRDVFTKHPELKTIDPNLQSKVEDAFLMTIEAEMLVHQLLDEQMLPIIAPHLFGLPAREDSI